MLDARRDLEDLADRFEAINEQTRAELRALRTKMARMHALEAFEAERDEGAWLN
jgi:hypothetical protein